MTEVLLFMDMEFPRGRGPKKKSHGNSRGWGEYCKAPPEMENPRGGSQTGKKKPPWGVWIFSGTTQFN